MDDTKQEVSPQDQADRTVGCVECQDRFKKEDMAIADGGYNVCYGCYGYMGHDYLEIVNDLNTKRGQTNAN